MGSADRTFQIARPTMTLPVDNPPWLGAAIGAAGDVAYDLDLATDQLVLAGPWQRLFGPGMTVPTGEAFNARINPEDLPGRLGALADHIAGRAGYDGEYRLRDSLGQVHWVHDRAQCLRDAEGRAQRLCGVLRTITERREDAIRRAQGAGYDDLTGHFSRARLIETMEFVIAQAKRHETGGALMAVGIDGLAAIEDAQGEEAADRLVIDAGRRLDACLRATDMIARLSHDTFGVLLSHCDQAQLLAAAARIRSALMGLAAGAGLAPGAVARDPAAAIGVSVGGVCFPSDARNASSAIARAESALATVRRLGGAGGGFRLFQPSQRDRSEEAEAVVMAKRLHDAMRESRLAFAYQPIVSADTLAATHHECLLRVDDGDGAASAAPGTIAAIERLGDIPAIDRKTLDMALAVLERHPVASLSVNLSGLTVTNRAWLRSLNARLRFNPDLARRLMIEITETAAMRDIEDSARFIAQMRALGVRVALDDFGAGFTSFRHLKALAVDVVKIDSSFVAGVAENVDSQLFIKSLTAVAHGLGLKSVAEGVATPADEAFLRGQGVSYFQGNRYGAPTATPGWMTATV